MDDARCGANRKGFGRSQSLKANAKAAAAVDGSRRLPPTHRCEHGRTTWHNPSEEPAVAMAYASIGA
jgi:hypothetical protein